MSPTAKASPRGAAQRVSAVHSQARPTFALAALCALGAVTALAFHPRTGRWLPLHLFMVGSLLGSILAATQLLAVTWSSSPAPSVALARAQRVTLFTGVVAVALGREVENRALIGIGGLCVVASLVLLIVSLITIRRAAVTDRYAPAIWGYVTASTFGIVGVVVGAALASGAFGDRFRSVRGVHLSANALGLVGIVVAATLPYFLATQARMKMNPLATSTRISAAIAALSVSTVVSLLGWLIGNGIVAAAGAWTYALTLVGLVALFPRVAKKQLDWAGPRLVQIATGYLWWVAAVVALGFSAIDDGPSIDRVLVLMVVGGFAQILWASLNYFAPVISAGKRKPGEGLRLVRSWVGLVAGNVAAIGIATNLAPLTGIGLVVWVADAAYRLAQLARFVRHTNA